MRSVSMRKLGLIIAALLWAAPVVMAEPCPCAGGTMPLTKTCGGGSPNACEEDDCCGDLGIAPTAGWECCGDEEFDPSVDECCEDLTINPIGECDDGDSIWIVGDGYVGVGGVVNLAVGTAGSGSSPTYQWTLVQGGGSLSDTSGESVTLTVGSSPDSYEIKVEDTQSNEVAYHSVQSVRVTLELSEEIACDGEAIDITVRFEPASVASIAAGPSFTVKKFSGDNVYSNPEGIGSQIIQVGSDITSWKIDIVLWFETEDPCNPISEYKIEGTMLVDGFEIDVEQTTFKADATVGNYLFNTGCLSGRAHTTQHFANLDTVQGDSALATSETCQALYDEEEGDPSGTWCGWVNYGSFVRDVKAEANWRVPENSQYLAMIINEELEHKMQFEDPYHPLFKQLWHVDKIKAAVDDALPVYGDSSHQAKVNAINLFEMKLQAELDRSVLLSSELDFVCAKEREVKMLAGSTHIATFQCNYEECDED